MPTDERSYSWVVLLVWDLIFHFHLTEPVKEHLRQQQIDAAVIPHCLTPVLTDFGQVQHVKALPFMVDIRPLRVHSSWQEEKKLLPETWSFPG